MVIKKSLSKFCLHRSLSHRLLLLLGKQKKDTIRVLPRELIDAVLDNLCEDQISLMACSLAALTFTTSARCRLFREVKVKCWDITAFLKLMDGPLCTMSLALSRLVIYGKYEGVKTDTEASYLPSDHGRLLSRLQGVQYIKLDGVSLDNISPQFWDLLSYMKGVKELVIHQMSLAAPVKIFRYICMLPALEALSISRSCIQVAAVDLTPLRPKLPFHVPFLDVRSLSPGLLDWFLAQNLWPPVHTFNMRLNDEMTSSDTFRQFVTAVGSSIENLQITLPENSETYPLLLEPVDLSTFCNIRSLHIHGFVRPCEQELFSDLMGFIFRRISSPVLEKISLTVSVYIAESLLFFGFPDHTLLNAFSWTKALDGEHGENLISFELNIRGLPLALQQRLQTERALRMGPFASLSSREVFSVTFN